jgi:ATP-dependent DNA helicase RecQ
MPGIPIVALTATAEPHTREDILKGLNLTGARSFVTGFDRPNIRYTVIDKLKPALQLRDFLAARSREAGIVYALSRKRVESVTDDLNRAEISAAAYHAGLSDQERKQVQEDFQRDDVRVVVATVAFGMGIDKSNVRFVVHYDIPKNIESYYQETGRAGRDGLPADALLLLGYGDIAIARGLIEKGGNAARKRIELQKLNTMVGFAESRTCRRQVLLGYFGEKLTEPCGNCDVCLNPPEMTDVTEAARKALSCVYRVGQRFGLGHVIDVLRGSQNQRLLDLGHNRLSTFGIGKEESKEFWAAVIRTLIYKDYLKQDLANYSVLTLTAAAKPLLQGEEKMAMARPRVRPTTERQKKVARKKVVHDLEYDQELFERLRQLRKRLADQEKVPPFVIFSDASLVEIAATLPENEMEFLLISGVGKYKLEKYGEIFLREINGDGE